MAGGQYLVLSLASFNDAGVESPNGKLYAICFQLVRLSLLVIAVIHPSAGFYLDIDIERLLRAELHAS